MEELLNCIKAFCRAGKISWTNHAIVRMVQRSISREDVKAALLTSVIIENYPDDYPYPSCLILSGNTAANPLHIVCGITDTELWIVTVYRPNPAEWESDFKTRRENRK